MPMTSIILAQAQLINFSDNPIKYLDQNPVMFSMILFGIILMIVVTALHDQRKQNTEHIKRNDELAKLVGALRKRVYVIQQRSIAQSKISTDQINELKAQRAEAILEKERSEAEKINLHTQLNQTKTDMIEMRRSFNLKIEQTRSIYTKNNKLQEKYDRLKDEKNKLVLEIREFKLGAVYGTLDIDSIKNSLKI